jgi:hypothetical protein
MNKYYVTVTTRLVVDAPDNANIYDVLNNMDYNFSSNDEGCQVLEEEMVDINIKQRVVNC